MSFDESGNPVPGATPDHLPQAHKFTHEYCYLLHDRILELLIHGDQHDLFTTRVDVSSESNRPRDSEDVFQWLERTEQGQALAQVLLRAVLPALLSDFCHFVYEALACSRKGKLSVAFTLLRKPLKETLLYLEWLAADPEEFLHTLYEKDSVDLSLSRMPPDRIKRLISIAVSKCPNGEAIDPDLLFRLRYEKNFPNGFDGLCNRAMHLITTKQPIATERRNFNFVFSGPEEQAEQWNALYVNLPYVLFHALEVVEVLFVVATHGVPPNHEHSNLRKTLGWLLWIANTSKSNEEVEAYLAAHIGVGCTSCRAPAELKAGLLEEIFFELGPACTNCGKPLTLESLTDPS